MNITTIRHGKRKLILVALLFLLLLILAAQSLGSALTARALPTSARLPIYATDDGTMRLSITFNCAWGADDIPEILDILDRYGVRATFFVVGVWAEQHPDAVRQIYARGHEIGNHSYSHRLPSQSTEAQLREEITRCSDAVERITGERPILYRAPSGDYTDAVVRVVEDMGMFAVKWSADSIDWKQDTTRSELIRRVLNRAQSGGIVLFHNDTAHTVSALEEIFTRLQERGFTFVPVSELIYRDGYTINSQGIQVKKH